MSTKKVAAPAKGGPAQDASWLPIREGEDPWTPQELDDLVSELRSDADRIRAELAESKEDLDGLMREYGGGAGDDSADTGGKVLEREQELTLTANSESLLAQTERSLERIDNRTYGLCESCGRPIGKLRLQAFPRATQCVACKQKQERR